jgi:hypothetical protein
METTPTKDIREDTDCTWPAPRRFIEESAFIKSHKEEIREKYAGKFAVVVGSRVIAAYDNLGTAYRDTAKTYEPGHFMIKKVPATAEEEPDWPDTVVYVL